MLDKVFINRLKKTIIFVIIFTILYIMFFKTLKYTLPFVLGLLIAYATKDINEYLHKRLKMPKGLASIFTTTIVFSVLTTIIILLIYKATAETIILITKIPSIDSISIHIDTLIREINSIIGQIEPVVVSRIYEYLQTILEQVITYFKVLLNSILSLLISLPSALVLAIVTFFATFLFSKDLEIFRNSFYSMFSNKGKEKMRDIVENSISMTIGYAKAYVKVVFITFIEIFIGMTVLGIDYALILSLLCAIFDILPIIGMIMIFLPLIIYKWYVGETVIAIGLIALYLLVTGIRQVIEPKIVSNSLDLHPILTLAAIFIGIKVSGLLGMIYFIALLVAFKVLRKVNVI